MGPGPAPGPPPLPGSDGRPVRASYQLQLQVQALLMTMTDEQKSALGHSETDLIVDCEFAGTTCSSTYVRLKLRHMQIRHRPQWSYTHIAEDHHASQAQTTFHLSIIINH